MGPNEPSAMILALEGTLLVDAAEFDRIDGQEPLSARLGMNTYIY